MGESGHRGGSLPPCGGCDPRGPWDRVTCMPGFHILARATPCQADAVPVRDAATITLDNVSLGFGRHAAAARVTRARAPIAGPKRIVVRTMGEGLDGPQRKAGSCRW